MILFFKKLRQQLLNKNKFGRYLLYAIGEIVLVVIGILIALAVNNSNQNRALKKKEQTYLHGLHDEFTTSQLKLKELIAVNKRNFEGAKTLLQYTSHPETPPTERVFSELLFNTLASDISFNPNNSLLNEIINSGSLKDLSNDQLRILLTNWIATIEDISKQETDLGIQREKVLDLFRSDAYSLKTIFDLTGASQEIGLQPTAQPTSNLELLQSQEFENNLLMFALSSSAMEATHYSPLMDDLNAILELIDAEIEQEL
ncbi:DUF6090 family protein [Mangrovimonas sp. YM274]|uniref:DUF6090 family protein n=1 Tax=Mangrovimonas sp. YM274 TaxID=3070660 RepID=UPI0027DDA5F9|nr:DUF6090 family protein [Mangrovimonas sp. YM274]WMI69054.1 DUF6090 family protein [Mangrovimonas sp. YM274]